MNFPLDGTQSRRYLGVSIIVWLSIFLLAINAFLFISASTSAYVRSDVWRHLEDIVIPIVDGSEGFSILWSNHHASPLLHILQIINISIFDFRLDLDAYFGFLFQLAVTAIIVFCVLSTALEDRRALGLTGGLCLILIASIQLGFSSLDQYTWPLVATIQYLYFFYMAVLLLMDRCVRNESLTNYLVVAALALFLIFANTSFGTIFLASIFGTLCLIYILDRQSVYLRLGLVIFGVLAAYSAFLVIFVERVSYSPSGSSLNVFFNLFENPLKKLTQISHGLSSSLVDFSRIRKSSPGAESFLVIFSMSVGALYLLVLFGYLRKGLYRKTLIPLFMMASPILFSVAVLVNREFFTGDIWSLTAGRYVPTYKLGLVGMIWSIWLIWNAHPLSGRQLSRRLGLFLAALVTCPLLFIQAMQISAGWMKVPEYQAINAGAELTLYLAGFPEENKVELPFAVRGIIRRSRKFQSALAFLAEKELSVFSDKYPRELQLEHHIDSRQSFGKAQTFMALADSGVGFAEQSGVGLSTSESVIWKALPHGIEINNTGSRPLYIRLKMISPVTIIKGFFLFRGSDPLREVMGISKGTQNHYVTVEKGGRLGIKVEGRVSIEEIELRL